MSTVLKQRGSSIKLLTTCISKADFEEIHNSNPFHTPWNYTWKFTHFLLFLNTRIGIWSVWTCLTSAIQIPTSWICTMNLVLILVVYSEQRQKLFARILSCFYEEPKLCTCFQSSPCTFTSTTASQNLPIEVVLFDLVTFLLVLVRWKRGALKPLIFCT